nr:l-type lectin-domain containing receptor kinase ix.1 [Quercus suber]
MVLLEWVTIGFLATTGLNIERHILESWEFNSSLDINTSPGNEAKKHRLIVVLIVSGSVLIAGEIIAFTILWIWKGNKKEIAAAAKLSSINDDLEKVAGPRRFSYNDLVSTTNSFSNERKLGQGGFGAIYKGGEFLLVYEFMPNGSLDTHLFGKRTPLTWEVRYKIFLGLASAVFYLHEESEQCVVHHDIKASNVMLDYSFNAKLGDFGYIDPEYLRTGKASKESDMYSFGVIALEIVTRRKSIDPIRKDSETGLLEPIWNLYGKGDLLLAVDEKL